MGEVYRADDLTLGQPVALKFLPASVERDPALLERLIGEVRMARTLSHPNLCRVYDVGEDNGRHFLSMEFIDGEDLASLLSRIGHLPMQRGIEVARQICAGLSAAHAEGVLHRDLKPANVMIDGKGRARITDFGLAIAAHDLTDSDAAAGTPAYMAPELRRGRPVTVQSDLYALGLILYELFTGRRAFVAANLRELDRMQSDSTPAPPSSFIERFDPVVERAILRCLEPDASERPASALQVAAALPGGDPLAAALLAGETPSPEMVAAAGAASHLHQMHAWALFLLVVLGLVATAWTAPFTNLVNLVRPPRPPAVLADRAQEIVRALGGDTAPVQRVGWFTLDQDVINLMTRGAAAPDAWARLPERYPGILRYVYRTSPRWVIPFGAAWNGNRWSLVDPPRVQPGMVTVELDPAGKLLHYESVVARRDSLRAAPPATLLETAPLFAIAGLDTAHLEAVVPIASPPLASDTRRAWIRPVWSDNGGWHGNRDNATRYEAAADRGVIVYFDTWLSSGIAGARAQAARSSAQDVSTAISIFLVVAVFLTSLVMARRNVKLGRGDQRGAFRVATFIVLAGVACGLLQVSHVADPIGELQLVWSIVGNDLAGAVLIYMLYLALEPFARRFWPQSLISWSRLLVGRWSDPRVGRDILVGCLLALVYRLGEPLANWMNVVTHHRPTTPDLDLTGLRGGLEVFSGLLSAAANSFTSPFTVLLVMALLRLVFKRSWIAGAVAAAVVALQTGLQNGGISPALGLSLVALCAFLFVISRFGLVAAIVATFGQRVLDFGAITNDPSAWYAGNGALALAAVTLLAAWGLRNALGHAPRTA